MLDCVAPGHATDHAAPDRADGAPRGRPPLDAAVERRAAPQAPRGGHLHKSPERALTPRPGRGVEAGVRRVALLTLAVLALVPGAAAAKSNDSLAPPDAPPHWLPPEAWVYNHWIPYDEGRLYALLHITREQLWQQLRDDHRNVAQLAARHGWRDPGRLADALVAPWRGHVSAARVAVLRGRAVRTITQGHLSQHLFFHSLHQFAIPSRAPQIFGLSDAAFRDVRRTLELSPLTIARLHGRSPARVEALQRRGAARARPRGRARATPSQRRQARMLLRRQITPASTLARAGALQRAAQDAPRAARRPAPRLRHQPVGLGRRHARRLRAVPPEAAGGAAPGRDRGRLARPAQRPRHARQPPGGAAPQPAARSALGLQRDRVGRRAARGLRVLPGQRELRQALRAHRRATWPTPRAAAARGSTTRRAARTSRSRPTTRSWPPTGATSPSRRVRGAGTAQVFVCDLHTGARTLASAGLPRAPRGTVTSIYEPRITTSGRFVAFTAVTSRASRRARARRPRRSCCATSPSTPRRPSARPGGLRLRSHGLRRRAPASPSPRASRCRACTCATWRRAHAGAHRARRRRRGRSPALRRRPRARLHGRAAARAAT